MNKTFASAVRVAIGSAAAAVAVLAPAAAAAQRIGQGDGAEISWWRVIAALILCIALAVGAALVLRKRMGGGPRLFAAAPRRLELIEMVRLGHQNHICIVRCDDRNILIAATPGGVTLLDRRLPPPGEGSGQ